MFNKLKIFLRNFFRKINNKCTAFMFAKNSEYVSVQYLKDPVIPRIISKPPGLNMGYNPKKRGPTILHQFQARGGNWTYNPYFVSFLRAWINMDAFPTSFLNGKREILVGYDELISDLRKLGHDDYTNAFKRKEKSLVDDGIIATTIKDDKKFVFINEWDLFITAIDAYAMCSL